MKIDDNFNENVCRKKRDYLSILTVFDDKIDDISRFERNCNFVKI